MKSILNKLISWFDLITNDSTNVKIRSLSLIMTLLMPLGLIAAPQDHGRILDEGDGGGISPMVGLVGLIILFIVSAIGYFTITDENGKRDGGCGCMLIMMIGGIILGVLIVSR